MPHLAKYITTKQGGLECCNGCKKEKSCCVHYYRQRTIEMTDYDAWLPNVRIAVSEEIPDDVLYDYIRRGCIEFAKRSTILRRNIHLQLQDCVGDYYPCLGEQERIHKVRMLAINGQCYEAIGDTCTWNIGGYKYWFAPPHTLEIHPAPKSPLTPLCRKGGSGCGEVILTVVSVPREDSDSVDSVIHDRYFYAIESYAIAMASMLPLPTDEKKKQPHSSLFMYRMAEFNKAVTQAKIEIAQHYSNGGQRW